MGRILVVDDEPEIEQIFRYVLESRDHTVLFADDGSRGLGVAIRQYPDVIVLDLMMPVMDGFKALEHLATEEKTRHVPVVVLTALTTSAVRDRCLELGAASVITKPFDPYEIADEIEAVLAQSASA